MTKVLSFKEIEDGADGIEYKEIQGWGGSTIRIGSLSSADMIQWVEENDDKVKQKDAGLRLIVKSLVDTNGGRVDEGDRDRMLKAIQKKNARENGRIVREILDFNGLTKARAALDLPKNDSSEGATGASPSSSPSQSAA